MDLWTDMQSDKTIGMWFIVSRRYESRKRALSKVELCMLAVRRCCLSDKQYRERRVESQFRSRPSGRQEILCLYDLWKRLFNARADKKQIRPVRKMRKDDCCLSRRFAKVIRKGLCGALFRLEMIRDEMSSCVSILSKV